MENDYVAKAYMDGTETELICLKDGCVSRLVRTKEMSVYVPPMNVYICGNEHVFDMTAESFDDFMRVQREGIKRGGEVRTTSTTGGQKGVKEARFDLIPPGPLKELAILYGRGALKYAEHNWRKGYEWEKSGASIDRHHNSWRAGYDYDVCSNEPDMCLHELDGVPWTDVSKTPDTCYNHTGMHHMVCVAWHAFAILEFRVHFPDHDNRFKYDKLEGFDFNEIAISPSTDRGPLYEKLKTAFEHTKNLGTTTILE